MYFIYIYISYNSRLLCNYSIELDNMNSFVYIPLFVVCTFEYVKSASARGLYEHVDMWIVSLEWNPIVWMAGVLQFFFQTSLPSSTFLQKVMPVINMNKWKHGSEKQGAYQSLLWVVCACVHIVCPFNLLYECAICNDGTEKNSGGGLPCGQYPIQL